MAMSTTQQPTSTPVSGIPSDRSPGATSPTMADPLAELAAFPFGEALFGRRSRRFALGDEIPDGPLAYRSRHEPVPLSELERMLVLSAMGATTGWHYSITRNARYAPHAANYAGAAAGRTFPSAAGFHTAELFFTDDSDTYFFPTRAAGALVNPAIDDVTPQPMVERHRDRVRRLSDRRLHLPPEELHLEGHNTWCVNVPGSLLVVPVADIAHHRLAILCFLAQNGYSSYDDVHRTRIPGIEAFADLVDVDEQLPLTLAEQNALTEATVELVTGCYAGVLMMQATGLGGWMLDEIDRFTMLDASDNPNVPGLGFRYDQDERWSTPNPTGLPGVFEAFCPPHHADMAAAVEAFAACKFGPGGPSGAATPARGRTTPGSAAAHRCTTNTSRRASHCRRSTSSTPSASSRARCRPCSSSTTSRRITWTSSSVTNCSRQAPIYPRTPITWRSGTARTRTDHGRARRG
jgi:hypothetical protein